MKIEIQELNGGWHFEVTGENGKCLGIGWKLKWEDCLNEVERIVSESTIQPDFDAAYNDHFGHEPDPEEILEEQALQHLDAAANFAHRDDPEW